MRVGLAIPAYNVEVTLPTVLNLFDDQILSRFAEVLVIDNNSEDATLSLALNYLKKDNLLAEKLTIIRHEKNYGYGSSIKTAFDYFIKKGLTHILIVHGDNQTDLVRVTNSYFKEVENNSNLDLVIGSRFKKGANIRGYNLLRRIGNYGFNLATWLITGLRMSDAGTAIILAKTEILKKIPYHTFSNTWQFHPQLNLFFYRNRLLKVSEISLDWADSEAKSSLNLIPYGIKLLKILLSYRYRHSVIGVEDEKLFEPEGVLLQKTFKIYQNTTENP